MAKRIYRKEYPSQFEAAETVKGFNLFGANIDGTGPTKVASGEDDGRFYVYVELEGDVDNEELLAATGYEAVG